MTICKQCGVKIPRTGKGRPRVYCSEEHKRAYAKQVPVTRGQQALVLTTRAPYNLPVHLMFQNGPTLVMPAPAHR